METEKKLPWKRALFIFLAMMVDDVGAQEITAEDLAYTRQEKPTCNRQVTNYY